MPGCSRESRWLRGGMRRAFQERQWEIIVRTGPVGGKKSQSEFTVLVRDSPRGGLLRAQREGKIATLENRQESGDVVRIPLGVPLAFDRHGVLRLCVNALQALTLRSG